MSSYELKNPRYTKKLEGRNWNQPKRPRRLPKELTPEEKANAIGLLRRPSLLFDIGVFLCRLGLAGETVNAMILYLIMTSRLLQNILSAAIKGESGVGKNTLIEKVATLFPEDAHIFFSGISR